MQMKLVGGYPAEPEHGNWDQLTSLPGPPRLIEALFREISGADVSSDTNVRIGEAEEIEAGVLRHTFRCGTEAAGYVQTERVITESKAYPVQAAISTHGLPGMTIDWSFSLEYEGQLEHCGFRHGELLADFESSASRQQFQAIYEQVYGHPPQLANR